MSLIADRERLFEAAARELPLGKLECLWPMADCLEEGGDYRGPLLRAALHLWLMRVDVWLGRIPHMGNTTWYRSQLAFRHLSPVHDRLLCDAYLILWRRIAPPGPVRGQQLFDPNVPLVKHYFSISAQECGID